MLSGHENEVKRGSWNCFARHDPNIATVPNCLSLNLIKDPDTGYVTLCCSSPTLFEASTMLIIFIRVLACLLSVRMCCFPHDVHIHLLIIKYRLLHVAGNMSASVHSGCW